MAQIKEAYVSVDVAQLLRDKGFDVPIRTFFNIRKDNNIRYDSCKINHNANCNQVSAPTQQMAMCWLREVHNLCIEPYRTACGYLYTISNIPYGTNLYSDHYKGNDEDSGQWTTYEKAVEAAIKYCLENLIV